MTDDLKAPERIWATEDAKNFGEDRFHTTRPMKGLTEYVRADLHATLEAALADMTQQRDAAMAGAVKIKPLIWDETHEDRGDGSSEHNGGYEADSAFGVYEIGMGFGSDSYYWSVQDGSGNEIGSFDDPDNAKAAAQAHYNARILSALTPDPSTLSRIEAQAEARGMRICADIYYTRCCADDDGDDVYREMMSSADATEAAAKGGCDG